MKGLKVVLVTGSLGDWAGGLASAVRAWAEALADSGCEVTLFCLDLTVLFGPNRPSDHPGVETVTVPGWVERRTRLILAPRLRRLLQEHCELNDVDVIHANGAWLPGTRIAVRVARRLRVPCVISPHGHLEPWRMAYRPIKKQLAWNFYGRRSLARADLVQAAADSERSAVRALSVDTPVAVVPNAVAMPPERSVGEKARNESRTVLFFSRVHPSKGLPNLVAAWDALRPAGWRVVIAGPDEIGHSAELKQAIEQRGLTDAFEFVGPVAYDERWDWYRAADLFVLPTFSENFGVTVAEALAAGVPVITTRGAPWAELEEASCGWWIDTGAAALTGALAEATALSDEQRHAMGDRGRELVRARYSPQAVSEAMIAAYKWVLYGGHRPGFIS